jgi:sarcosine oxidase subunit alpha
MLDRPGLNDPARPALVGLTPLDPKDAIRSGSILIPADAPMDQPRKLGWISSATPSPMLGHSIALGFVEGGMQRAGETLHAYAPLIGERVAVQVVSPHFFDPSGERMKQ